jgi:maltose alpha-D-glucosyltransferase/alpha-amylase
VANLSRFDQFVEVDLSGFEQAVPTELRSRNLFPPVGSTPYPLTLAPHAFLWLALERAPADRLRAQGTSPYRGRGKA